MSDAHIDPLMHVAQDDHPDRIAEARARAGRAIRDLGHAVVGHHATVELIDRTTTTLTELTAEWDTGERRSRAEVRRNGQFGEPPLDGGVMTTYDERPISGRASPWGLDITVRRDGEDAVCDVTLRAGHEGAPGRSHGGIVAALFDDVYGFVLAIRAQPGFTGELAVRYEAGVPIGAPLECRVRFVGVERRKLFMSGELTDRSNGQVVARSTATFITIDHSAFLASAPQP
jgi:acyl-coenzyme A thioesterase PaaI-like protein